MASEVARYAAAPDLLIRQWPGETAAAVFSPDTVSTHLVNEWGSAVLEVAATRTVSAQDLVLLLGLTPAAVDSDAVDTREDLQRVQETITGLVAAGLLRRVE